ncbi:MAG TPA: TlpA disulfide reductase family protein [Polyangiaceae bacterium]|nr:TlpA disulfide reductase family protein [Polyangiaceae bacterium]
MPRVALFSLHTAHTALSCLLVFASGCSGGTGPAAPSESPSPSAQLAPPDFELSTVDGKSERLSEHLGKEVVLLDFWATFCEPCLAGMPHLDALYRKHHAQGFTILGISIDGPDSVAQVKTTVSKLGISFPILLDQETRVVALYNPKTSAPYSVLIGRDGRILKKQEGYTTGNAGVLDQDVADALAR